MPRKFVTGDSRDVVVKVKRERVEVDCQGGCGRKVTITTPYSGDILCPECSKGCSYRLEYTNEKGGEKT